MALNTQLKKQIYRKMYLLTTIAVVLTTLLLVVSFYRFFDMQMRNDVKARTTFFEKSLNYSADNIDYITSLKLTEDDTRLSIINQDGTVGFDSYKDHASLENHLDRPEIRQAFEKNYGEVKRFSETLNEETFYCAVKLSDGTVLRLAQTTSSIYSMFVKVLPLIVLIVILIYLLCNFIAVKLTKKIVAPINELNLDKAELQIYDELTPFIRTIFNQKEQIKTQLAVLENHATTITAITKSMSEGLIILDANGSIISVNNSVMDMFRTVELTSGVKPINTNNQIDFTGKNILEFTRDIDIIANVNNALNGNSSHNVISMSNRHYEMIASPVFQGDIIIGAIILFLDVTVKLNADKQRREFSANVSHELKTPLTTISGYAEMINNGMVQPPDIVTFSGKIKDEASRLLNLIEDIIRLSELDEEYASKQLEQFDVLSLATNIADSLKPSAKKKSIEINVTGTHGKLNANMRMIDELIYNLVDNAIKYNKVSGVVDIDITNTGKECIISVSDTGIGIAKVDQERVFERFYRVDKSRSKKTGGTGLGLAIVKHIVAYHNGIINLSSQDQQGTTIDVTIPMGNDS